MKRNAADRVFQQPVEYPRGIPTQWNGFPVVLLQGRPSHSQRRAAGKATSLCAGFTSWDRTRGTAGCGLLHALTFVDRGAGRVEKGAVFARLNMRKADASREPRPGVERLSGPLLSESQQSRAGKRDLQGVFRYLSQYDASLPGAETNITITRIPSEGHFLLGGSPHSLMVFFEFDFHAGMDRVFTVRYLVDPDVPFGLATGPKADHQKNQHRRRRPIPRSISRFTSSPLRTLRPLTGFSDPTRLFEATESDRRRRPAPSTRTMTGPETLPTIQSAAPHCRNTHS